MGISARSARIDAGRARAALLAALACGLAMSTIAASGARAADLAPCVPDGTVNAITHLDGNTYIGGQFDAVGQRSGPGVPLAQSGQGGGGSVPSCQAGNDPESSASSPLSGEPVRPFPEAAGGDVYAAISDGQGGWYIGGTFTSVGDQPRAMLAHIKPDGSLYPDVGAPPNGINCSNVSGECAVRALALDPTKNVLYVGGNFAGVGSSTTDPDLVPVDTQTGATVNESNQSTNWSPPTPTGTVDSIEAVPVNVDVSTAGGPPAPSPSTPMSILIVGGSFTGLVPSSGGSPTPINYLAALWGAGATQSNAGTATPMGGDFVQTGLGATPSGKWTANLGSSTYTAIDAVAVGQGVLKSQLCGSGTCTVDYLPVYAGGACPPSTSCPALLANQLALITSNSAPYTSSTTPGELKGSAAPLWSSAPTINPISNDQTEAVGALAVSPTTLYFGGDFAAGGGAPTKDLAALPAVTDPSTTGHSATLDASWSPAVNGPVNALAVNAATTPDTLYAGGAFTNGSGSNIGYAAAWTGANGAGAATPLSDWNPSLAGGEVDTLALGASGPSSTPSVYAGGAFESSGAAPRSDLAAFDAGGNLLSWSPALSISASPAACVHGASAAERQVEALAASGSTIYAGGLFDTPQCNLAAFDASSGQPVPGFAANADNAVLSLASTGDAVYAGGRFASIGGQARHGMAKLDPASGAAGQWNANLATGGDGLTSVNAINASCSTVYAGGDFSAAGGASRNDLAALDPSSGAATSWNPDATSYVDSIVRTGSIVYVAGGGFDVGQGGGPYVAALDSSTGKAYANFYPAPFGAQPQSVNALALAGSTIYEGQSKGGPGATGGVQNLLAVQGDPSATDSSGNSTWGQPLDADINAFGQSGDSPFNPYIVQPADPDGNGDVDTPAPDGDVLALSAYGTTLDVGGNFVALGTSPQESFAVIPLSADVGTGAVNCGSPPQPSVQIAGSGAFGNQPVHTTSPPQTFTVTNVGSGALSIPAGGVALVGADSGQYVETADGCSGRTIAAGSSCTVQVVFAPATAGPHGNAILQATDNALNSPQSVALSGTGIVVANTRLRTVLSLTGLMQSHRRWRERGPVRHSKNGRASTPAAPLGTTFSFVVNERARVTFVFTRELPGRKVGRNCVRPTTRNRRHHGCARTVTAGTIVVNARAGRNKLSFTGRLSRLRRLPPGTYTLIAIATADGQRSAPRRLSFTIVG